MKFAIFGNKHQTKKSESIGKLFDAITSRGDSYSMDSSFYDFLCKEYIAQPQPFELITGNDFTADVAISFGGDGTFLRTASRVGSKPIPVLGINAGRLGFLTASSNENIDEIIGRIHDGDYDIEQRTLIQASTNGTELKSYPFALNEIAIMKHDSSSMITLKATINGCDTITYQADGLIVATPSGSTGYSLSVGGPIIAPEASVFTLTPIAPHSLSARPLIVSDNTNIEISVSSRSGNYLIAIDGRNESCDENTTVTIKKASYSQLIIRHREHSFIQNLQEKLMWGADIRE